jgi:3',5'-cyclic AMP phosphodiesterase CpdA
MRIWHVSDLHVRSDEAHNKIVADQLAWISVEFQRDDVLIVTGDVTDDGRAEQCARAADLLRPFAGRLVLVPGNHDYGSNGLGFSPQSVRRFAYLRASLRADKPFIFRVDGEPVGEVLEVNACLRTGSVVDFAQGQVGRWNLWKLRRKLDAMRRYRALSVVAVHHNPYYQDWFCRLQDAKEFFGVVLGRADIVLMGHEHRARHSWFPMNLPEGQAQTRLWAAGALCREGTEVVPIVL